MNIPRHIKPKPIHVLVAVRAKSVRVIVKTFRTAWRAPTRCRRIAVVKEKEFHPALERAAGFGRKPEMHLCGQ